VPNNIGDEASENDHNSVHV